MYVQNVFQDHYNVSGQCTVYQLLMPVPIYSCHIMKCVLFSGILITLLNLWSLLVKIMCRYLDFFCLITFLSSTLYFCLECVFVVVNLASITFHWFWFVQTAARMNKELHNVNANIKRKLIALEQKSIVAEEASDIDTDFGVSPQLIGTCYKRHYTYLLANLLF